MILVMIVKENQNLLDTNLWSGGEYDNSLNNIASMEDNQKIMISNQWQSNGETSFLIKRGGGTGYNWTRFRYKTTNAKLKLTIKFKYTPRMPKQTYGYMICIMEMKEHITEYIFTHQTKYKI